VITHTDKSGVKQLPADDALVELIAREVREMLSRHLPQQATSLREGMIPLGISNRHIHLTQKTFHALFGDETAFEVMRPLYQPGEFASNHLLTIVGPKQRAIPNVRILGPLRSYDQVEVSLTDAIYLGIDPPVTNSGSLENAAPLTLAGPRGSIYLEHCAIVANRHVHMSTKDADRFGVKNGDFCRVRVGGEKSTVFEHVLVRTNDNWKLQIHLDTDDANAANIRSQVDVEFLGKM
jgi:propanediol utilization protein